jgi:hypothetical protein
MIGRVAVSGWRLALALLLALAVLALILAVAVWLAIAVLVIGAVLWLNLALLPRLARRLRVPGLALELLLLPVVAGPGWYFGGPTGAALGATAWLASIAGPRLIGRRLRARLRTAGSPPTRIIVVDRQLE